MISLLLLSAPTSDPAQKKEYHLNRVPCLLGRGSTCDVVLPDSTATLSRRHVKIFTDKSGKLFAQDLSTNGTFLNGKRATKNSYLSLNDGDILTMGAYRFLIGIIPLREDDPPIDALRDDDAPLDKLPPSSKFGPIGEIAPFGKDSLERRLSFENVQHLRLDSFSDPFAEALKIRAIPEQEQEQKINTKSLTSATPLGSGPRVKPTPVKITPPPRASTEDASRKTNGSAALETAIDRFLETIDPHALEREPALSGNRSFFRKRSYWEIYKKQFSVKRARGDYQKLFREILVREIERR